MTEKIVIDEKYTYAFDNGKVEILRNGEPWLGAENGSFEGSKAWIAAANLIKDLQDEVYSLNGEISDLIDTIDTLEGENRDLEDQISELEN